MNLFEPSREDGRSDRQVVYDFVKDAEPGTLFLYDDLRGELEHGVAVEITRQRIGRAARAASRLLLKADERALQAVPGHGYRVAHARDHITMAQAHQSRAHTHTETSLTLVTNVREVELTAVERELVRGLRIVLGSIGQMMAASERRQDRFEKVLEEIRRQQGDFADRLAKVEGVAVADAMPI